MGGLCVSSTHDDISGELTSDYEDDTDAKQEMEEIIESPLMIDKIPMNEHRRMKIKVIMLMRFSFRDLFGLSFSNRCGHFIDLGMSLQIHSYFDSIVEYKPGDHELNAQDGSGHRRSLEAAVVSDDGWHLFTGSNDRCIIAWDLRTDSLIHKWIAHNEGVLCLAYRSGLLVSGSNDNTVGLWNAKTFRLIRSLEEHTTSVRSIAINRKATEIISGAYQTIRLWSVQTGQCLKIFDSHLHNVLSVLFIDKVIVSGSWDGELIIWDPYTLDKQYQLSDADDTDISRPREIFDIRINCDRSLLAICDTNSLSVYHWPNMKIFCSFQDIDADHCDFHPSNPYIIAVQSPYQVCIKVMEVKSKECLREFDVSGGYCRNLCFTPNGQRLISASYEKFPRLWDVSDLL